MCGSIAHCLGGLRDFWSGKSSWGSQALVLGVEEPCRSNPGASLVGPPWEILSEVTEQLWVLLFGSGIPESQKGWGGKGP